MTTGIEQRIANIIRTADGDHSMGAAELAEVLVRELGLYRHLAFVKQCGDGEWRQWHGPADKPNPEGVIPGMRYVTSWEPQFVQDVPDA